MNTIKGVKMVLISNVKGRSDDQTESGYERLFGHHELGILISKIQSAVISAGTELEKIIADEVENQDGVSIQKINKERRIFKEVKNGKDVQVDCVIMQKDKIILIEIKDGDTFDTKKVAGEIQSLFAVRDYLIRHEKYKPENIQIRYCSFNAINHEQIEAGTKHLLPAGVPMTGYELCEILDIDYDDILQKRKKDQKANVYYFLEELNKIPDIHEKLQNI